MSGPAAASLPATLTAPGAHRHALALAVTAGAFMLALGLGYLRLWEVVESKVFDELTVISAPGKTSLPITIVGVDEASFAQIGKRWPWPRDLHAQLVDRLSAAGAAVIAFDMVFSEASDAREDRAFGEAIKRAGGVVMASDHAYQETALLRQWIRVDPLPELRGAGAAPGLATVTLDQDAVVRRMPAGDDIFWSVVIQSLMKSRPGAIATEPRVPQDGFIRHLGPAHTFPYVSYYQVIQADKSIPADFFQDQIVLVGRDVRASPEVGAAQADMFATPFLGRSKLLTPGVEIHANIIENVLTGQVITRVPALEAAFTLAVAVLLGMVGLLRWHPFWSGAWFAALVAATGGYAYWLFDARHQWLPAGGIVAGLAAMYLSMGVASYLTERRRSQSIKGTFSKYVSAHVVEQMIAHPEKMRLGGERREVTLLFCDLAGFTSISEKLPPDGVARVVNAYFSAMTKVIMGEEGTVDKYIGDAVMAFWGAPLDEPRHALRAVRASIGMQKAMVALQAEYLTMGITDVGLRIGLNSGVAVIGNMGSEERVDYTALGDAVNLASRLEGVNKAYGTGILLSESTAEGLRGEIPLRPVDRVRVKGKEKPVHIFTPCDDPELVRRSERAIEAYAAQRWAEAREAFQAVLAQAPGDPVAVVFLQRIEEFEAQPPGEGWDGSVALEKG